MRALPVVGLFLAVVACGGDKAAPADAAASMPTTEAAMASDSVMQSATDTVRNSAAKAGSKVADQPPLRDSAFGPKFMVDSTGKVTPIKRP